MKKILKYLLITMCVLRGIFFAVMECSEPYLDENMQVLSYIHDMNFFIKSIIIYSIIGYVSGWFIWFCIDWLFIGDKK
jgi:hypothetical protein